MTESSRINYRMDDGDASSAIRFVPSDPDGARACRLGRDSIERYNRDGFLAPLSIFDPSEARQIRAYFDDLLQAVLEADDPRNAYSINTYHMVCRGLYDLVVEPRILDLVEHILGPDFVCWGSHAFCKLPGDRKAIPMHQDAIYWPWRPAHSVTVWLAIDDVDEENAAMQFVRGSHLHGPLPHEERPLDGSRVLQHAAVDPDRYGTRVSNTLAAGEVSLHSDLLLHGSPPNASSRRRAGLTLRYAAADVDALEGWEGWKIPAVHCRGRIPDHWPHRRRPSGEHPERMAEFWGGFDGTPPDAS